MNLRDYSSIKSNKKSALNYFKRKEKEEKNLVYDLVLVDIWDTYYKGDIKCVKRNIYDPDLQYIAISYRWGELDEQQVNTPDYTAHITSFAIDDLERLCKYIKMESDLKEIQYLWIDAISIDQQNQEKRKEAILYMSDIYKQSAYILAVPDLHMTYLYRNPANEDTMELIHIHRETILEDILTVDQSDMNDEIIIIGESKQDIKKIYKFLAFLVNDWSNRAWVISEYLIAKQKNGTPLKYIFMTLLHSEFPTFFSYSFDDYSHHSSITINSGSNHHHHHHHHGSILYNEVDTSNKLIHFLKTRFIQRDHMDMLLSSNATRNEDRFNAILPLWGRYKHLVENKNTISEWNITSMTSVRLKLYEFMDNLWDKAALLYACSHHSHQQQQQKKRVIILPSYASQHNCQYLHLIEEGNPELAYERYLSDLMNYGAKMFGNDDGTLQHILYNGNKFGSLYNKNLKDIQWHSSYLTVASKKYFFRKIEKGELDQDFLSTYSLWNEQDNGMVVEFIY
ncbi:unnamed protein product [Cunninghamella echinulata]